MLVQDVDPLISREAAEKYFPENVLESKQLSPLQPTLMDAWKADTIPVMPI